jgi:conjugal transfer pilus assembly protein TraU
MKFIKVVILSLLGVGSAYGACTNLHFVDPINDIDWDCIFPITLAGIPIDMGEHPPDSTDDTMMCSCPNHFFPGDPGVGFLVGFWEPAMLIDTVGDAWCFPALGVDLGSSASPTSGGGLGYTGGGSMRRDVEKLAFQHYHYYTFPVWGALGMFSDVDCVGGKQDFALTMISEVRPDWSDDLMAMQLYPETAVMANPGVVLACVADAVAATIGNPIDALYWCMGSWQTTYPMTGNVIDQDYAEANAAVAGHALYLQARWGELPDRAVNYCADTPMPIWVKSHYRLQEIDPVAESQCHQIGEPGLLWTAHKNPVGSPDNFSWVVFRKVHCCVVVF